MAKTKRVNIAHNVKERFRHQNLQRLLENVASHVPHLPTPKNETKAKKLRRIVLYMRFLLQKQSELPKGLKTDPLNYSVPEISEMKNVKNKERIEKSSKVPSEMKFKSCPPQIVFLRKISDQRRSPSAAETNAEANCPRESESECNSIQKARNEGITFTNEDSSSDLMESQEEVFSFFDNYSPYSEAKQLPYRYYSCHNESEVNTNGEEKHSVKAFTRPWERNLMDQFDSSQINKKSNKSRNSIGATLNPTQFSFIDNHHLGSKGTNIGVRNSAVTSDAESMTYLSEMSDFNEKYAAFRNRTQDKLAPVATFIPSMSQNDHANQKKYHDSFYSNLPNVNDDMQKDASFAQDTEDFPFKFFSSGESVPIASSGESAPIFSSGESVPIASSGESAPIFSSGESIPVASSGESAPILSGEWFSSDEMEYGYLMEKMTPKVCDTKNIPQRAAIIDDTFVNCDIYNNPAGTFCDIEQYINLNQDNKQADMYEHYGNYMTDSNLGMINSSDYLKYISDYNSPGHGAFQNAAHHAEANNEEYSRQQKIQEFFLAAQENIESNHSQNLPKQVNHFVLLNKSLSNLQNDNAFEISKFGIKSENPDKQKEDSATAEYPAAWKYFSKPDDIYVPHDPSAAMDLNEDLQESRFFGHSKFRVRNENLGCQLDGEGREFGHSSFRVSSDCYGEVKVKQEDTATPLLAEEISFSLNNLDNVDWSGEYFNVPERLKTCDF